MIARLTVPAIAGPTAGRIGDVAELTDAAVATATVLAVAVAVSSTLRPTLRAVRTATVTALTATAQRHRPWLTALSALLPTPNAWSPARTRPPTAASRKRSSRHCRASPRLEVKRGWAGSRAYSTGV
ncbi:hypothetical protein [Spongiactinospora sp. 9N601]|uniref:hypothetical protein n=1 Tax=Spongiactinospora sp. 9N601 TaxID=3375149 RepID=UPI0037A7FF45